MARCDLKKFTDYIFSDKYAWNGKKDLFENDETKIFLNRFKDTNNYSLQHTIINELTSSNSNVYNLTSTERE